MQYVKQSCSVFTITIFIMATTLAIPVSDVFAQSGRGRPRVPQPSPTAAPPPPIKVPASTSVAKQEQKGTTSRFVLRNGMTIVINEQHATPLAAAVAYFKIAAPQADLTGVARLVAHMVLKGTVLRPGERATADLRSLGASAEATTLRDGTAYSVLTASNKIKAVLAIQADMLQHPLFDAEAIRQQIPLVIEEERSAEASRSIGLFSSSHAFNNRKISVERNDRALERLLDFDDPAAYSLARLYDLALAGGAPANLEALRGLSPERVITFYRTYYRPENLILSVSGDVSAYNILVEIQQLYGEFGIKPEATEQGRDDSSAVKQTTATSSSTARTRKPETSSEIKKSTQPQTVDTEQAPTNKPSLVTEPEKLRYSADRADISQTIVSVGYPLRGIVEKDLPTIGVLTALIGRGRASRLGRSLIDGQMTASRIDADYLQFGGAGFLTIQVWLAADPPGGSSLDKAESILFKELDRLRRELPSQGELARARTVLEKEFLGRTGGYLRRAQALAHSEASGAGFLAILDYPTRIRAVTAEDVQRFAAKHLTLGTTSIHEYEPLSAASRTFNADTFAATVTAWAPDFARPVESAAVRPADATNSIDPVPQGRERSPEQRTMFESVQPLAVRDFSTLNGPKAFVREDHSKPETAVAILFQGGRLIEDAAGSGTTELMLRSILYGNSRRTFSEFNQELEQLGADVRIVVEPDFYGFVLSALSRNADRALKLLRDAIEDPAFRDDDIARARLAQIASIRDARDSSFERSRELLLQTLFPGHAYSLPPHGREEVINALTGDKLRAWYASTVKRQMPVAVVVGDTDGSALVSSHIADGFKRRDVDNAIQVKTPQPMTGGEKTEQRRRDLTGMAIGFPGLRAESSDLTTLELIVSAMNGRGGRLFRDLREKRGAISSALVSDARFVAGTIAAYVASSVENESSLRTGLLAELDRIAGGGLTPEELESARATAVTLRTALLQEHAQHAIEYARAIFYRKQASDVDNFGDRLDKVTPEEIKRVVSAYLKTSAATTAVIRGATQQPLAAPKQN